jgi:hypothetical protein
MGDAVALGDLDKQAVVLALDLRKRIAERLQEILVGGNDRAVDVELDDSLRFADRRRLSKRIARSRVVSPRKRSISSVRK